MEHALIWPLAAISGFAVLISLILTGFATALAASLALKRPHKLATPARTSDPMILVALLCVGLCIQGSWMVVLVRVFELPRAYFWLMVLIWLTGAFGLVSRQRAVGYYLKNLPTSFLIGAAASLCLGLAAIIAFPFAYDTAELASLGTYLESASEYPARARGMAAYQGAIFPIALLAEAIPLPVIGGGMKLLIAFLGWVAIDQTRKVFFKAPEIGATLLATSVLFSSTLVNFGFLMLGKDSIVGVILFWLGLVSCAPSNYRASKHFIPLIMTAAYGTGIIVLPYIALLALIQIAVSKRPINVVDRYANMAPYSVFLLPYALSAQTNTPIAIILALVILAYALWIIVRRVLESNLIGRWNLSYTCRWLFSYVPILSLIFLVVSSPLDVVIDADFNFQWSELKPPLGEVGFYQSLYGTRNIESSISPLLVVLTAVVFIVGAMLTRSSFLLTLFSFPFLVMVFCYLHLILDLKIIRYRLLWDLYKDVPQWLGGFLVSSAILFAYSTVENTSKKIKVACIGILIATLTPTAKHFLPTYSHFGALVIDSKMRSKKETLMDLYTYSVRNPALATVIIPRNYLLGAASLHRSLGYHVTGSQSKDFDSVIASMKPGQIILDCETVKDFTDSARFHRRHSNLHIGKEKCIAYELLEM